MRLFSSLAAAIVLTALALPSPAMGQCDCPYSAPRNFAQTAPPPLQQVTYAGLFTWRNEFNQRLQKLESRPQGGDQASLIIQLQAQIAQLNAQIAAFQRPAPNQAPQNHYHIYSPGGPPIALNPNPGPVIPLNPNPGPVIPFNPNPGPPILLNPSPGPSVPLNPNPGPTIPLVPAPSPRPTPPPPTGYQTYTPFLTAQRTTPATAWQPLK